MPASQRFGVAVAVAPKRREALGAVLGDELGAALAGLRERLAGDFLVNGDPGRGTAILADASAAVPLLVACQEAAWPVPLRAAVVVTPPAGAAGRDEAVRAKAVQALDGMGPRQVLRADLPGRTAEECALVDQVARLHRCLVLDWTETRRAAVRAYRRLGRQLDVARELQVSQQAVSQMLLGARFRDLQEAERDLQGWLSQPLRTTLWPLKRGAADEG